MKGIVKMTQHSLVDIAYTKIRENLITANYMPGMLLSENVLAKELNMSRTPIRGAISRLESEGFVSSIKNRGIFVKEISMKELLDISQVILFLQEFTVDEVEARGLCFDLEKLKMYLELQLEAEKNDDYYKYIQYHILFTQCMISSANNKVMLEFMDSLKDKFIRMAMVNWKLTPNQKHYSANQLNKIIYDAICLQKYSSIKQICKETFLKTRERIIMSSPF
ncbi:GntR family transcriptional regulator [Metabacillus sediminilitoris]|uniref:GntR family transcriptional regulator n=1 Tax=Metabacillus sediminilitoris TaxID=2567941 RepID=A0A4S4BLB8_9BACI|nr:GntR family transcriptional regulator [Metabacillus sediminilitoris]QGQ44109.1 GntR family transcriptional regulator [Metabacillus sediminilitoris]THF75554.1 GntR family transcriptional regulator [Metabacillus sediminilitoris]